MLYGMWFATGTIIWKYIYVSRCAKLILLLSSVDWTDLGKWSILTDRLNLVENSQKFHGGWWMVCSNQSKVRSLIAKDVALTCLPV